MARRRPRSTPASDCFTGQTRDAIVTACGGWCGCRFAALWRADDGPGSTAEASCGDLPCGKASIEVVEGRSGEHHPRTVPTSTGSRPVAEPPARGGTRRRRRPASRVGTQRREHRAPVDTGHDLGLLGRSPVGEKRHLDVDHVVGHRTANELRHDPLERPTARALSFLGSTQRSRFLRRGTQGWCTAPYEHGAGTAAANPIHHPGAGCTCAT